MNRILFSKKGCTEERNIPNLWPVKKHEDPGVDFFSTPGLTLKINPKFINKTHYVCEFFVVNNLEVSEVTYGGPYGENRKYLKYNTILSGIYREGYLQVTKGVNNFDRFDYPQREATIDVTHHALRLIEAGIREFEHYFPDIRAPRAQQRPDILL